VLGGGTLVGVHARVVAGGAQAGLAQGLGDLLGVLAGPAVDDRRAVGLVAEAVEQHRQLARLRSLALELDEVEAQVGAIEARADHHRVAEAEALCDLGGDVLGRGRGAGHHRRAAEPLEHPRQAQIVGAEVVAPLRDAVGLVDGEQVDLALADCVHEAGLGEALGRAVDDPGPAVADLRHRAARHLLW
jgi:hypothetical protein